MALVGHRSSGHMFLLYVICGHYVIIRCYYFKRTSILSKAQQIDSAQQTQHDIFSMTPKL